MGEGTIAGTLWKLTARIPIARVPPGEVILKGDPVRLEQERGRMRQAVAGGLGRDAPGPQPRIAGELFAIGEGRDREVLGRLDDLEGFSPGPAPLYLRVLVAVEPATGGGPLAAWTYVDPSPEILREPLAGPNWP